MIELIFTSLWLVFKYAILASIVWLFYAFFLKPYLVVRHYRKFGKLCAMSKTFTPVLGDLKKFKAYE